MASPSISAVEKKTRKHRAIRNRQAPSGFGKDPDNVQDMMPVQHKEVPDDFMAELRARKAFKAAGLLGQDKLLGQMTYDPSMVHRAQKAAGTSRTIGRLA